MQVECTRVLRMNKMSTDSDNPMIRSVKHDQTASICFVNRTQRKASVYWFDYSGKLVRYLVVFPGKRLFMNTFMTHPWCAKDSDTNAVLLIDKKGVYLPTPDTIVEEHGETTAGKIVYIDIPVYSLKERCEQVVLEHFPNADVSKFEIPMTLKNSLTKDNHLEFRVYKRGNPPPPNA